MMTTLQSYGSRLTTLRDSHLDIMKLVHKSLTFANKELLHYTQWGSSTATTTIVLLHGAPGSYLDFEKLAPLLVNPKQNVIAFDLPGNGRTDAKLVGGLFHVNADSVANSVAEALPLLSLNKCVLVGHSVGGRTTLEVASQPSILPYVSGIALLNPMGLRAPRWQNPLYLTFLATLMRYYTRNDTTPNLLTRYNRWTYVHRLKFSDSIPSTDFLGAFYRMTSANIKKIAHAVQTLRQKQVPAFVAVAKTDRFVEPEIGHELASALNAQTMKVYQRGGHNIPVTQAENLANDLNHWISKL